MLKEHFRKLLQWYISLAILTIIAVLVSISFEVIGYGRNVTDYFTPLKNFFIFGYLPLIISVTIGYGIIQSRTFPILYVYYNVWIGIIYNIFKNKNNWLSKKFFSDYFKGLVVDSFNIEKPKNYPDYINYLTFKNKPVFVLRIDLMKKSFWPNWAYVSVLLFNSLNLERYRPRGQKNPRVKLKVDLRNQSYGIYNNAGKLFLKKTFINGMFLRHCFETSETINKFLMADCTEDKLEIPLNSMPLRWASGGVLPIATYPDRQWFVLFFRDIEPVGLNIANGSSELKDEYKKLNKLIYREFSEEVVLLDKNITHGDRSLARQKIFQFPPFIWELIPPIQNESFSRDHRELRKSHDDISIIIDADGGVNGPIIENVTTPFELELKYHDENMHDRVETVRDVIFNVNPTEFGIEILRVVKFNMEKDDILIDGEIWDGPSLVRQPVVLISCDYLQKLYLENNRSLGDLFKTPPYMDCKSLKKIPREYFIIFDDDVGLRRNRLIALEKDSSTRDSKEAQRYRGWLEQYEDTFNSLKGDKGITSTEYLPLTMLCPVTWKTIEKLFEYQLIKLDGGVSASPYVRAPEK